MIWKSHRKIYESNTGRICGNHTGKYIKTVSEKMLEKFLT